MPTYITSVWFYIAGIFLYMWREKRAMAAASSLISLNFTNCQLCALVNIFVLYSVSLPIRIRMVDWAWISVSGAAAGSASGPGWFPFYPEPAPALYPCPCPTISSLLFSLLYLLPWMPICFMWPLFYTIGSRYLDFVGQFVTFKKVVFLVSLLKKNNFGV